MAVVVANCYDAKTGLPATAAAKQEIVYPRQREGITQPTPAKGAANVFVAIALSPSQVGLK